MLQRIHNLKSNLLTEHTSALLHTIKFVIKQLFSLKKTIISVSSSNLPIKQIVFSHFVTIVEGLMKNYVNVK